MFVEEVIHLLASNIWSLGLYTLENNWEISFINNIDEYVMKGNRLSTEQSKIILKLLSKFRHNLVHKNILTDIQINDILKNPTYRQSLYLSANIKKEVRYLGSNYIGFRFKFNDIIIESIKQLMNFSNSILERPYFNREYRIWVVPIIKENAMFVRDIILNNRFSTDLKTLEYIEKTIKNTPSICIDKINVINCEIHGNDLLMGWARLVVNGEIE